MNVGYLIHQAQRPLSVRERREADTRRGELALALSRLLRRNRVPHGPARLRLVEPLPKPASQPEPITAFARACAASTGRCP